MPAALTATLGSVLCSQGISDAAQPAPVQAPAPAAATGDWTEHVTAQGVPYYYNNVTEAVPLSRGANSRQIGSAGAPGPTWTRPPVGAWGAAFPRR